MKRGVQLVDHLLAHDSGTGLSIEMARSYDLGNRRFITKHTPGAARFCLLCQKLECGAEALVDGRWIHMLRDQVILKLVAPERHFHGLYVPDSAHRQAWQLWQGEVLAVGPGEFSKRGVRIPCGVKPGEKVLFYSLGGRTATRWPDKSHLILSAEYIQGIIEP